MKIKDPRFPMRHREAGICFVADAAEIPAGLMKFQRQVNMFFSYGETGFAFFLPAGCVEERIIKCL